MNAISYARVSTQKQERERISLEVQEDKIKRYTDLHNLELGEIVSDEGKSGKDLNREGIQKVMSLCQEGWVNHLIVYKMDRLTRTLKVIIHSIEKARENSRAKKYAGDREVEK